MNIQVNGFSAGCIDAMGLFALDRQRNIRAMIEEDEKAQEYAMKNFSGFSRITVNRFPGNRKLSFFRK